MKMNYLLVGLFSLTVATLFGYHYYQNNNNETQQITEASSSNAHYCAVQATPEARTFEQADGSTFVGFIKGTRAAHYIETKDGYTVLKDKNGFYKYAVSTSDGDLAITDFVVHEIAERTDSEKIILKSIDKNLRYTGSSLNARLASSPAATSGTPDLVFPSTGTRKALLLLVDFPDQLATYSVGDFDNLANQAGYNVNGQTGSFRDYYLDVSYGALTINTDVQGWYTAPQNKVTYGDDAPGAAATDLVRFAVDEAESAGLDYSQYDGDGDGRVDVVMVIHSGRGAEESGDGADIWSHRWALAAGGNSVTYDGVLVNDYIIQGEKYGSVNITNIGVLCHEFGHALGLPDLYDTDYSSSGISNWCLMAGGTWNNSGRTPAHMSAWCKQEMGWMNPTVLAASQTIATMDYTDNASVAYRINTPVASEYFLLENRQKQGWDANLPSEGLAIWHIDESRGNNADETHRKVNLEAGDGTDNGTLHPGSSNNTNFDDISTPNARTYTEANSGFCVSAIVESGTNVSFQFEETCTTNTCNDGILNGDETGIDCGGTCSPCPCLNTPIASVPSITTGITLGNGNSCDLRPSEDITYQFTVPTDGIWTITTCGMSDFDTYLLLGTTCCSNNVAENDNGTGCTNGTSTITTQLLGNTTYYVTVEGLDNTMAGNFELDIIAPPCLSDYTMVAPFVTTGITIGMFNKCDPNLTSTNFGNSEDAMYEIEIPNDGNWVFSLNGSNYDTYLFLGSSCCSMDIAFDDDGGDALTSEIVTSITAGTYYLTVDGWGGSAGNYNLDVHEVSCNTENAITESHCAGDDYSLTLTNGDTYNEANPSGVTTLVGANAAGCDSIITVNLTFNAITLIIDAEQAACSGDMATLTVIATANDATAFTYFWSNNTTTQTTSTTSVGTYTVTVTDNNGCFTTASATLSEPDELIATTSTVDISCGQNNGSATATVIGGTAPYAYLWSDVNAQTTATAIDLAAGTYTLIITDANACETTVDVTIIDISAPSVITTTIDATCSQNNGEIVSSVSGGVPPYSYTWSDANAQTTEYAIGLAAGAYSLTVTDANACTTTSSTTVLGTEISVTNITESYCTGDAYSLTIGTDIYDENNPNGMTILTNIAGCDSIINVNLSFTIPSLFTAPFMETGTTVGMGNSCDPSIEALFGDAEDALYEIVIPSDGNWEFSLAGSDYDTQLFLGTSCCMNDVAENDDENVGANIFTSKITTFLTAGTYFLTVDGWGGSTGNYNLEVYEIPCMTPTTFTATWLGETASLYDWNDVAGATAYEIQERLVGDTIWQTAIVNVSESPNIITHTAPATYQWQVRTVCNDGLTSEWSAIQSFFSRQVLSATFTDIQNVSCPAGSDGHFLVSVVGGLAPFQYSIDGITYVNTNLFTGLAAGTYTASVIDTANDTVSVFNSFDATDSSVVIEDGIYTIACDYCTSWSNNSSFDHIGLVDFNDIYNESGDDNGYGNYTNLVADVVAGKTYDIGLTPIITFANDVEFWNVWIDYNQDNTFSTDELALQTGGSSFAIDSMITIPNTAMAGTTMMRVQMMWNANAATACDTIPFGEVEDYTIIIHEPLSAAVSNIEDARCPSGDEGSFQLNVVGGLPPLSYSIDNGGTFQTLTNNAVIIENMVAGTYQVFIQDAEGTLITAITPDGLNYFDIQDGQPSLSCEYCYSEGLNTEYEYIQLVHFADINHSSGNDSGYGDFTNISTNVIAGDAYDITLTPFINLPEGFEYWSVWIDYNGDFSFSTDELAFQSEGTLDIVNGTILIPTDALAGETMMRVQMKWATAPATPDACETFDFGEVEDYRIIIEQVCEAPTSFNLLDPTPSTVTFDWNDVTNAAGYFFRERAVGANTWITADVIVSETANLMTHTSNTTYEWQVRTDCGNGNVSGWSALQTYTSPMADCEALSSTDLNTIISTNNGLEVTLEWMSMPNAQAYQLAGRKVGGNIKVFPETQLTSRTFTSGILYNTSYQWSIRVKCDGVWTDYALPPASFTTPSPAAKNQTDGFDIFADAETLTAKVYPNPTKNQVTVSVNTIAWENDINIAIFDMTGRMLMQETTTNSETTLNISHLNEGYYFVRTENGGAITTTKLVIMK